MSNIIKTEERDNKKIEIYYVECAECPTTSWDMGAYHIFQSGDRHSNSLSVYCDWKELFGKYGNSNHNIEDASLELLLNHASHKNIMAYMKHDFSNDYRRFRYDNATRCWCIEKVYKGEWAIWDSFPASELNKGWYDEDCLLHCDKDDYMSIIDQYCGDVFLKSWSSTGYSQGDYVEGFSFITKKQLDERSGRNKKDYPDWKKQAEVIIDGEVDEIKHWLWGDVYGYKLFEKVKRHISYPDNSDRDDEDEEIWEEIDSCWGFYCDPDELIDEIL